MNYPFLSLKDIDFVPELVARVPAYLAYYHLVIPVAEEDEQITLWMAYPDNPKVVSLFQELLGQAVFPVRGNQTEIRQKLDDLYKTPLATSGHTWLNATAHPYVAELAAIFHNDVADTNPPDFDALLKLIQAEPQLFSFVGVDAIANQQVHTLLQDSPASLLLLHGVYPAPKRILIVLQGHSPDLQAIQIALTIAGFHRAEITLLGIAAPMKRHHVQGIATLLDTDTKAGQHIQNCLDAIQTTGIDGYLKLRQGNPVEQVAAEFADHAYDLMLIPVETYGDFVFRVLEQIALSSPHPFNPILAVKPSR